MPLIRRKRKKYGKPISLSSIENFKIELHGEYLNPNGLFFGGTMLQVIEKHILKVAQDHVGSICKTHGIDFVRFFSPIRRGDILLLSAQVNRAWEDSLEVGVKIIADDFRLLEKKKIMKAYFSVNAFDDEKNPIKIIPALPETKEQLKRYFAAQKRREWRLKNTNNNETSNIML